MEDYLKVISGLQEVKGYAPALDIASNLSVSPASVSKMLRRLDENGYIKYEKYYAVELTSRGRLVGHSIRQKHSVLLEFFEILGIKDVVANEDVEGLEHYLSSKTLKQLRKHLTYFKSHPKIVKNFHSYRRIR